MYDSFSPTVTFWSPAGFSQRYVPKDWQRIRRSKRRDNDWSGLLRRYFRRRTSISQQTGFQLEVSDFNIAVYESRRQYYLVVNPSRSETGMFFVRYRHAEAFLNTHWLHNIVASRLQIVQRHLQQQANDKLTEQLQHEQVTHELLQRVGELMLNLHQAMQFNNRQMTRILYALLTGKTSDSDRASTEALLHLYQLRGEQVIEEIDPPEPSSPNKNGRPILFDFDLPHPPGG